MTTKKECAQGAPDNSLTSHDKDTKYFDQFSKVQVEFFRTPSTMMQVARRIGIDRSNVCWFTRDLRLADRIWSVRKGRCPITGYPHVNFYSTNPEFMPKPLVIQTKLF